MSDDARAAHVAARPSPPGEPRRRSLSVVVPVLNEERGLQPLVDRLRPVLDSLGLDWEVIFVDDGSTDGTLAMLKALNAQDPRLKAISLSRNFGKEIAMAAGLQLRERRCGRPDGRRPAASARADTRFRRSIGARASTSSTASASTATPTASCIAGPRGPSMPPFQKLSGTTLPEGAGDFRLLDRKAVDAMNRMRERVQVQQGAVCVDGLSLGRRAVQRAPAPGQRRLALAAAPAAALRRSTASPRSRPSRSGCGPTSGW